MTAKRKYTFTTSIKGFTLIEVMVVIVLIGIMATLVQFTTRGNDPVEKLNQASARFAAVFEVATEYSMLNNIELGLVIDNNSYQFLGYDGIRWSELPQSDILTLFTMEEGIELTLSLDDLPLDEDSFFSEEVFTFNQAIEDEDLDFDENEKKKKIIPQIYLLSGGDITPFSLTFAFEESGLFSHLIETDDGQTLGYRVTGIYTIPLKIEGPYLEGK
jgi:general secretion pathway protein H